MKCIFAIFHKISSNVSVGVLGETVTGVLTDVSPGVSATARARFFYKDTAAMKTIFESAGFEIVYYGVVSGGNVTQQQ